MKIGSTQRSQGEFKSSFHLKQRFRSQNDLRVVETCQPPHDTWHAKQLTHIQDGFTAVVLSYFLWKLGQHRGVCEVERSFLAENSSQPPDTSVMTQFSQEIAQHHGNKPVLNVCKLFGCQGLVGGEHKIQNVVTLFWGKIGVSVVVNPSRCPGLHTK